MGDGRTIAVSIQPRLDGGWVTTHQDITEREKLAAKLEQQNVMLKARETARCAERALQYNHQQHAAGVVPVQCRPPNHHRQS
jgi:hypothetical protein